MAGIIGEKTGTYPFFRRIKGYVPFFHPFLNHPARRLRPIRNRNNGTPSAAVNAPTGS